MRLNMHETHRLYLACRKHPRGGEAVGGGLRFYNAPLLKHNGKATLNQTTPYREPRKKKNIPKLT